MKQPVVSIVLTTYDSEKILHNVLDSILDQNFPLDEIELIIVDGGSRDATLDMVKKFIDENRDKFRRIELIVHDKNYGVSKARNDGIKASRGEYLLILDHDVVLSRDTVKSLLEYLERAPQKIAAVKPLLINEEGGLLSRWAEQIMSNQLIKTNDITACALVRRGVVKEIGYYDETLGLPYTIYEDIEYGARALTKGYEIHVLGWLKVRHLTRYKKTCKENRARYSNIIARLTTILGSLISSSYRYALRKYLSSAPLTCKIRWGLYSITILMLVAGSIALAFGTNTPLLISLIIVLVLYLDVLRQYWNPRVLRIALMYSAVALAWRIARSTMLLIPDKCLPRLKGRT